MAQHSSEQTLLIEGPGLGIFANDALDNRSIPDRAWSDARNVRFYANGSKVRKSDCFNQFDTTPDPVRQLMRHVALDGTETLVRVTFTNVYKDAAPPVLITGTVLTASLIDIVTWDQFEDLLFWTDRKNPPQVWDGITATVSAAGTPTVNYKAQIVRVFKSHILYMNVNDGVDDFPWRIEYSATGTPQVFTGATSGVLDLVTTPGGIIAAEVQSDRMICFKRRAIHRVDFVGLPLNFVDEVVSTDDGATSPRVIVKQGPYLYYLGDFNFYRLGSSPEVIGDPIFTKFQEIVNLKGTKMFHAFHRPDFEEIVWRVTSSNAVLADDGSGQCDLDFVYNYRDNTWSIRDCEPGTSFVRTRLPVGNDSWDGGDPGDWDTGLQFAWNDSVLALGADREFFSQVTGDIQQYRGLHSESTCPCIAYIESKIFHLNSLTPSRVIRIPLIAQGIGQLRVLLRTWDDERQPAPAYSLVGLYDLSAGNRRPWVDVRAWGRLVQIRLENAQPEHDFQIEMYGIKHLPAESER